MSCGQKSLTPLFPKLFLITTGHSIKDILQFLNQFLLLDIQVISFLLPSLSLSFPYSFFFFCLFSVNILKHTSVYASLFHLIMQLFFQLFLSSFLYPIIQLLTINIKRLLPKLSPRYRNFLSLLHAHRPPFKALKRKLQGQGRWANPFLHRQ